MTMKWTYPSEKVSDAVQYLAASHKPLRERIYHALADALERLRKQNLEDLGEEFEGIMNDATTVPATGDEGDFMATLNAMEDDEVRALAERIVWFGLAVERRWALERGEP